MFLLFFQTISQINSQIVTEKGNRVKLLLSSDGIRIIKSTMIQGKMLHDFIPLERIQFMTVSQNLPDLLLVISLTPGDVAAKFQVNSNIHPAVCPFIHPSVSPVRY